MSKAQVLQLYYKEDQGLTLLWNFSNPISSTIYFRHIIVLHISTKEEANQIIRVYIKKIKPGDLFYILFINEQKDLKHIGWREKPVIQDLSSDKVIIKHKIMEGNKQRLMEEVERFYHQFSEPIVATIFTTEQENRKWFQRRINSQRLNGRYNFMVAIFSSTNKSNLSFGHNVSSFSIQNEEMMTYIEFWLKQVYQAGMVSVKLTVECLSGSITSMDDDNWRTISFNQIERIFYGPSIKYQKDLLFLFNKTRNSSELNLKMKLQFQTLERRKYKNQKAFAISIQDPFQRTFTKTPLTKEYHVSQNIWLTENPFTSFTVVKYQIHDNGI